MQATCRMKDLLLLFSLVHVYLLIAATTAIGDGRPPAHCALVKCARPLCADPVIPEGECCPSCENSQCLFKGCVQFLGEPGSPTVQWKPNGCGTCICADGHALCFGFSCPPVYSPSRDPCFGRPQTTSPTECCNVCDYGVPEDECAVVPDHSLTYRLGLEGSGCSVDLTFHHCDKRGYMDKSGRRFQCSSVMGERSVKLRGNSDSVTGSCHALTELSYVDVVRCVPRRNDDLNVGCDLYVD